MRRRGDVVLSQGKAENGNAAATERKDMRGLAKAKQRNERPCKGMAKKRDALQWYDSAQHSRGRQKERMTAWKG